MLSSRSNAGLSVAAIDLSLAYSVKKVAGRKALSRFVRKRLEYLDRLYLVRVSTTKQITFAVDDGC